MGLIAFILVAIVPLTFVAGSLFGLFVGVLPRHARLPVILAAVLLLLGNCGLTIFGPHSAADLRLMLSLSGAGTLGFASTLGLTLFVRGRRSRAHAAKPADAAASSTVAAPEPTVTSPFGLLALTILLLGFFGLLAIFPLGHSWLLERGIARDLDRLAGTWYERGVARYEISPDGVVDPGGALLKVTEIEILAPQVIRLTWQSWPKTVNPHSQATLVSSDWKAGAWPELVISDERLILQDPSSALATAFADRVRSDSGESDVPLDAIRAEGVGPIYRFRDARQVFATFVYGTPYLETNGSGYDLIPCRVLHVLMYTYADGGWGQREIDWHPVCDPDASVKSATSTSSAVYRSGERHSADDLSLGPPLKERVEEFVDILSMRVRDRELP